MNDPSLPQTDTVDNSLPTGLLADLMMVTATPSDPDDLIAAALTVLTAREACVIGFGETLSPILEDAINVLRAAVLRADSRTPWALSPADQMKLRGLIALSHEHIRLIEALDAAACSITGGEPGHGHTSDAIWDTNISPDQLFKNLAYARNAMTGKPIGGTDDGS